MEFQLRGRHSGYSKVFPGLLGLKSNYSRPSPDAGHAVRPHGTREGRFLAPGYAHLADVSPSPLGSGASYLPGSLPLHNKRTPAVARGLYADSVPPPRHPLCSAPPGIRAFLSTSGLCPESHVQHQADGEASGAD